MMSVKVKVSGLLALLHSLVDRDRKTCAVPATLQDCSPTSVEEQLKGDAARLVIQAGL